MFGRQACESGSATTTTQMQRNDGPATTMRPKGVKQQDARRDGRQQDATHRNHGGPQGPQAEVSMVTEYRESFLPPFCRHTSMLTSAMNPKHQPGWDDVETTVRSFCVTHRMKKPTIVPLISEPRKDRRGHKSAAHKSDGPRQEKMDLKTTYMQDFKTWNTPPRRPIKQKGTLEVSQGLRFKGAKELSPLAPMESLTSYRLAFVPHQLPVRPLRARRHTGQPSEPDASPEPAAATHSNREPPEVVHRFEAWSVETKRRGSSAPAMLQSPRNSPAGSRPVLPSIHTSTATDDAHPTTSATMEEDWELWDTPRRSGTKPADDHAAKRRSTSLHVEFNVPVGETDPSAAEVFSDFRCTTDNEHSRRVCWSGCVDAEGAPRGSHQTEHRAC